MFDDAASGRARPVAAPAGTAASGGAEAAVADGHPSTDATHVLRRLERIEALDRGRASSTVLLGELRELVREAEAWARAEAGERARTPPAELRGKGEGMS